MQKLVNNILAKSETVFKPKNAKWILLFFGVFYGLITFVNHYQFRTSSDPLGIYTNAIYDYAHFRANDCKLLTPLNAELETPFFDNKLSDHFTPIQFVIAPFYHLFGTYTLLIFQWIAILLGGWGVFKFFNEYGKSQWMGGLAMFHYFAFFAFHSALAFASDGQHRDLKFPVAPPLHPAQCSNPTMPPHGQPAHLLVCSKSHTAETLCSPYVSLGVRCKRNVT